MEWKWAQGRGHLVLGSPLFNKRHILCPPVWPKGQQPSTPTLQEFTVHWEADPDMDYYHVKWPSWMEVL